MDILLEYLVVLFFFAVGVLIWAAIGHAIWLGLAKLFGQLEEPPRRNAGETQTGNPLSPPTLPTREEQLRITTQTLARMHREKTISTVYFESLRSALQQEMRALHSLPPAATPDLQPTPAGPPASVPPPERPQPAVVEPAQDLPPGVVITPEPMAPRPRRQETAPLDLTEFLSEPTRRPVVAGPAKRPQVTPPPEKPPVAPPPVSVPAEPPPPRRTFGEIMQAFMEEKNIRWGEILSGLLIVGSSIGLVVNLWNQLTSQFRYFPALIFLLVTAGIHGAGQYTLRRWKLKSTSRGLLVISTLLIPLNFLVASAFTRSTEGVDLLYLGAALVGLATFGTLTWLTARTLIPHRTATLMIGVMGTVVGQLIISRLAGPDSSDRQLYLLMLTPLLAFLAAGVLEFRQLARGARLPLIRVSQGYLLMGTALFSFLMPVALLCWKTQSLYGTLARVAPCFSLAASVVLGTGLIIHRRLGATRHAGERTGGTALAVLGVFLMLLALVLAWPQPVNLLAVGLVNFVVLSAVAWRGPLPPLVPAAVGSLGLALIMVYHLAAGTLPPDLPGRELVAVLLEVPSAFILTGLAAVTGAGIWFFDRRRLIDFRFYGVLTAAGLAGFSLLIGFYAGFFPGVAGKDSATLILGLYAVAGLAVAPRARREELTWAASLLLLLTLFHAVQLNPAVGAFLKDRDWFPRDPLLWIGLLHATLMLGYAQIVTWGKTSDETLTESVRTPVLLGTLLVLLAATPFTLVPGKAALLRHAGYVSWATVLVGWLGLLFRNAALLMLAQILSLFAVAFGVTELCYRQEWWADLYRDPRFLQWQLGALTVWGLAWFSIRVIAQRTPLGCEVLPRSRLAPEYFGWAGAAAGLLCIAATGACVGVQSELALRLPNPPGLVTGDLVAGLLVLLMLGLALAVCFAQDQTSGSLALVASLGLLGVLAVFVNFFAPEKVLQPLSIRALTGGSWIGLGLLAAVLVGSLRFERTGWQPAALAACALTVPLLTAVHFSAVNSSASALRWMITLTGAAVAGLVLSRRYWLPRLTGDTALPERNQLWTWVRLGSLLPALVVISALSLTYLLELHSRPFPEPTAGSLFAWMGPTVSHAGPFAVLTLICLGYAIRERKPGFALSGSLACNAVTSLVYLLPPLTGAEPQTPGTILFVQWNAVALAGWLVAWLGAAKLRQPDSGFSRFGEFHRLAPQSIQLLLTVLVTGALSVFAIAAILRHPAHLPDGLRDIGSLPGIASFLLTGIALLLIARQTREGGMVTIGVLYALALSGLVGGMLAPQSSPGHWVSLHTLELFWGGLAALCVAGALGIAWISGRLGNRNEHPENHPRYPLLQPLLSWAVILVMLQMLVAISWHGADPDAPWWSVWLMFGGACLVALTALPHRSSGQAWLSVGLSLLAVSMYFAEPWWDVGIGWTAELFLTFVQCNLAMLAATGCLWAVVDLYWRWEFRMPFQRHEQAPSIQFVIAQLSFIGVAALSLISVGILVVNPAHVAPELQYLGSWPGGIALHFTACCLLLVLVFEWWKFLHYLTTFLVILTGFLAAVLSRWNTPEDWVALHGLELSWVGLAMAACGAGWWIAQRDDLLGRDASPFVSGFWFLRLHPLLNWSNGLVLLMMPVLIGWHAWEPEKPWWSVRLAGIGVALLVLTSLPLRETWRGWLAVPVALVGVSFHQATPWWNHAVNWTAQLRLELLEANLLTLVLLGAVYTGLEIFWQRQFRLNLSSHRSFPPIQQVISGAGLLITGITFLACLLRQTWASRPWPETLPDLTQWHSGLLLLALLAGILLSAWERRAGHLLPGLYAWGLLAGMLFLDRYELTPKPFLLAAGALLAAQILVSSAVWRFLPELQSQMQPAGIVPEQLDQDRAHGWLLAVSGLLGGLVVALGFYGVLHLELPLQRFAAGLTVAALAPACVLLARGQQAENLQRLALMLAAVAVVICGWGFLSIEANPQFWLERSIRAMAILAGLTLLYGGVLVRSFSRSVTWTRSLQVMAGLLGGTALLLLLVVLGLEINLHVPGEGVGITIVQMMTVTVALAGLIAGLISLAVLPDRNPWKISESGRQAYVYAAEVTGGLLFLHIWLCRPDWFSGFLRPYWPFIVMGIAFIGVGVGELCKRLRLTVLSDPLQRTGAFLPLLPLLGYWIQLQTRGLGNFTGLSLLLFSIGLLYLILSLFRDSFLYGLLAAVAGNAALWSMLYSGGSTLLEQPQFWLIPPALSLLIAAQLNRDRLSGAQLTGIRYLCVMVIYVSSTGEMFLRGIGQNIWLPIALATFSIAGVIAGMLLRVRAFLYLGSSFLLLSVISMVAHAAKTTASIWPWWVFGICAGLALLTLFGIFEKKRDEMQHLLQGLKEWEK